MKVILLKDVRNVGRKHEIKDVSDGFAMNSLIPQKLAEPATAASIKKLEERKKRDADSKKLNEELLSKNIGSIENISIEIAGKGNEQGHLFAGIRKDEIVDELKKQGHLDLDPDHIVLDKPIKEAGEHDIKVKVGEKEASFKVVISVE